MFFIILLYNDVINFINNLYKINIFIVGRFIYLWNAYQLKEPVFFKNSYRDIHSLDPPRHMPRLVDYRPVKYDKYCGFVDMCRDFHLYCID